MDEATCSTCGHWAPCDQKEGMGQCRRHAPAPELLSLMPLSRITHLLASWPVTASMDYCGDHEAMRERGYTTDDGGAA
jgi:hypothetical protein